MLHELAYAARVQLRGFEFELGNGIGIDHEVDEHFAAAASIRPPASGVDGRGPLDLELEVHIRADAVAAARGALRCASGWLRQRCKRAARARDRGHRSAGSGEGEDEKQR